MQLWAPAPICAKSRKRPAAQLRSDWHRPTSGVMPSFGELRRQRQIRRSEPRHPGGRSGAPRRREFTLEAAVTPASDRLHQATAELYAENQIRQWVPSRGGLVLLAPTDYI